MMIMMIMIIIMIIIIIFRGVARTFFAVGDVEVNACVLTGNLVYTYRQLHSTFNGGGAMGHAPAPLDWSKIIFQKKGGVGDLYMSLHITNPLIIIMPMCKKCRFHTQI